MGLELSQYQIQKKMTNMLFQNFPYHPYQAFSRGEAWFVDVENGNDSAGGKDIWSPLKTMQQAIYLITQKRSANSKYYDEFIYLMPTNSIKYGEDSTAGDDTVGNTAKGGLANAYVYVNTPNIHIIGAGPLGSVVIKPDDAATTGVFNIGASGDRFHLSNVVINTATAQSAAIKLTAAADFPLIENCVFDLVGAAGPLGVGIDGDNGKVSYPIIRNCTFYMGTLLIAAIILEVQDATPFGGLIENCDFLSVLNGAGTGVVDVINVKDGTGLIIRDINIHGGDAGTAYNADDGIDLDAGVVNTLITRCNISGCDALITDGGTDTDITDCLTADGEGSEYVNAEQILPAGLS